MRNRVSLTALCVALALACPARATVTTTASSASYTCNGTTTAFTIPFAYLSPSHIVAQQKDAGGAVTTVTGTVKPSVAPSSGTLTLTTACPAGSTLTITRSVALTQPQSFRTGNYSGAAHEQAFDKLTMETQQNAATHATDKMAQTAKDAAQDLALAAGAVGGSATMVLATGTTAPRALSDRFADTVNVRDFTGVDATGVGNSTAGIQAAIATGKRVYFPSGIYLITSQIIGQGAWIGDGQGDTFDSNSGPGITIIRCSGANGGTAFVIPPRDMQGLHFDGIDKSGNGIITGADNGTFTPFMRWRNITVRNFNVGIHGYNWFNAVWDNLVIQGNHEGIRIDPVVTTPDGGYFTATDWRNLYIADNDIDGLYVSTPQGAKTWTITDIVIERNGANGSYQAFLQTVSPSIRGLYVEGTPTKPGLQTNNVTLHVMEGFFNGTGGINFTSNAVNAFFWHVIMATTTDTITGLSALSKMVVSGNSLLQTDPRASIGGRADVQWTAVAGNTITRQRTENITAPTYGTVVTIDTKLGNVFQINPTDAVAFTVSNPSLNFGAGGQEIVIQIRNTTAGALGAATFGTGYKLGGAWVQPAAGFSRTIKFLNYGNGSTWTETARTAADVPN